MEKSQILKLFLEKGFQIDIESLNFFSRNESALKKFLNEMEDKQVPSTITLDFVNFLLKNDVEIVIHTKEAKTITVEELSKIFSYRFNILKKILLSHLDLVNLLSISKITEKTKKFSLIAMVSKTQESSITVMDDTGEIDLTIDKKLLDEIFAYDVLGFLCEKNTGIHVRNVIFPDVPLRRNIKTLDEERNVIFAEKINESILKWAGDQKKPDEYIHLFKIR